MRVRSDSVERLHFLRDYLLDLIDYIFTSFFSLQIGESDEQYQPENKIKMQEETNEETNEEAAEEARSQMILLKKPVEKLLKKPVMILLKKPVMILLKKPE